MKTKLLFGLLLGFYAFFLASQKIILPAVDLGRHLKNGQLILAQKKVAEINLYSYTYPQWPTINHHWGSGVIFYLLYRLGSYPLLSLSYAFLLAGALFLVSQTANSAVDFLIPGLLALPLIASRSEVRPEGFSFFLFSLFLYLLWRYQQRQQKKTTLILFLLGGQLLWVNLHLFFIFGPFLIFLAALASFLNHRRRAAFFLAQLGLASLLISLLNPAGGRGLLIPFLILRHYGYLLAENQPLLFMQKRFGGFLYLQAEILLFITLLIGGSYFWRRQRLAWRKHFFALSLSLTFALLSWRFNRALPLFGLSFAFLGNQFLASWPGRWRTGKNITLFLLLFLIGWSLLLFPISSLYSPGHLHRFGWGLAPQAAAGGQFLRQNHLPGPIFNNYDVGSYLIWFLYPQKAVFVDNRPEAYPVSFFQQTYIPAQTNDKVWQKLEKHWHFQTIVFWRHDFTPWGQAFLIRRLKDKNWVPVYVDRYLLIFLRRNPQNQALIRRYQLPQTIFRW